VVKMTPKSFHTLSTYSVEKLLNGAVFSGS
jgi:hypothetical protein